MSVVLHRCCLSCLTCVLCVFMQLSLRSVWRCTWMAIAAPLATCGGYGRRAGGGHGVGGMRKACYLCQVGVMFQQRMCRLFCMALDVRFKGSLSAWCELLCQQLVCMRAVCSSCDANNMGVVCSAVLSAAVVLFVLQLSLQSVCVVCSCSFLCGAPGAVCVPILRPETGSGSPVTGLTRAG